MLFRSPPTAEDAGEEVSAEDKYAEEVKYRTKVYGNLKLIGQLIARRIISSKIAVMCIDELLAQNAETLLEALAVFLTDVARVIDNPNWEYHPKLEQVFHQLELIAYNRQPTPPTTTPPTIKVSSKCRFALQNLLDLRKANWQPVSLVPPAKPTHAPANQRAASTSAPRPGAWKPSQKPTLVSSAPTAVPTPTPSVAPTPSAFKGWDKPLPGVGGEVEKRASKKSVEESRKESRSALNESRGSRNVEEGVKSLREALEGLEDKEGRATVISHEQLCFALEANSKDQDLLLEIIVKAFPEEDLDVAETIQQFIEGPLKELKYDVPNAVSLVKDKLIPRFLSRFPSLAEKKELLEEQLLD